ncbi:FtsX-like permease family protein [Bacteroides thetaiotaomicron]|nr:FtsX-like permease family protein [Bacteroides thetaiotaomicron]
MAVTVYVMILFLSVSFYWNKILAAKADAPEMWHYSSRFHLWVLSCVCLLLLLAGILNFVNIYLVFMLKRSKEYGIRKVFGMRGRTLFLQLWTENVLMVLIALFFAWFFIEMFSGYANRLLESNVMYTGFRLAALFGNIYIVATVDNDLSLS